MIFTIIWGGADLCTFLGLIADLPPRPFCRTGFQGFEAVAGPDPRCILLPYAVLGMFMELSAMRCSRFGLSIPR